MVNTLEDSRGRPARHRSVPQELFGTVFRLYAAGYGYRAIANALMACGAVTSKSSVERLIRGLGSYRGRCLRPKAHPKIEVKEV